MVKILKIIKDFLCTGCPMLLNTSLNIKGQPLIHDEKGAKEFEELYGTKVFI